MTGATNFSLTDLQSFAEQFAGRLLTDYRSRLTPASKPKTSKEINDPLWGTISLAPLEVCALDSPLIQRLRFVRQLGVVHWVYPSAVHTRFEHTLGVLHQVQQLTTAINSHGSKSTFGELVDQNHINLLRLAALFHDVGHGAFSHVSEMALESLAEVNAINSQFAQEIHQTKQLKPEDRKLSEIFAYCIFSTTAFAEFIFFLVENYSSHIVFNQNMSTNAEEIVEKIKNSVVGLPISNELPLLHEVISGPFDADKLDYFVRDASLAGIPNVLDISRLIQKIEVRKCDARDLPADIGQRIRKAKRDYYLFGIKWSGAQVLDELHLARILLFSKIYKHQKVISLEMMLKSVIEIISEVCSTEEAVKFVYSLKDDEILSVDQISLCEKVGKKYDNLDYENKNKIDFAIRTIENIRNRRLYVKAFQIQMAYPNDSAHEREKQEEALIEYIEDVEHVQKVNDIRETVGREIQKVISLIDLPIEPLNDTELKHSVLIYAQSNPSGASKFGRAFLLPTSGDPIPFRSYMVNRMTWAETYMSAFPKGYVFAPREISEVVYVALEKVLHSNYGVWLPHSAIEMSKQDAESLDKLKRSLAASGYYEALPHDIRPMPDRLMRADVDGVVDDFCHKIAAFQEPQSLESNLQSESTKGRVLRWLKQFETDDFIECALDMLRKFKVIGRTETVGALRGFIDSSPEFRGSIVVPFGDVKDSSALLTYYANDLGKTYIDSTKSIRDAAEENANKNIIFVDDIVASGGQAQDLLANWFEFEGLKTGLDEQRNLFDEDVKEFLRSRKIAFVFVTGWDNGIESVQNIAEQVGLTPTVYRHLGEDEIPFAFTSCFGDIDQTVVAAFRTRCEAIGAELLGEASNASTEDNSVERKKDVSDRILGYGNRAMLISSTINVPTQTMTLIWKEGVVDGVSWQPLMRRRKKR